MKCIAYTWVTDKYAEHILRKFDEWWKLFKYAQGKENFDPQNAWSWKPFVCLLIFQKSSVFMEMTSNEHKFQHILRWEWFKQRLILSLMSKYIWNDPKANWIIKGWCIVILRHWKRICCNIKFPWELWILSLIIWN